MEGWKLGPFSWARSTKTLSFNEEGRYVTISVCFLYKFVRVYVGGWVRMFTWGEKL